ncbi:MAG TPA: NAD(+) synthase [Thermomicrobiaceae bacterium]|nr:NAD(+) synthase [Thermomicrobiaceae bacterium]
MTNLTTQTPLNGSVTALAPFHRGSLLIDPAHETERISAHLRHGVLDTFGRKGAVVAVSGGIDSAVTLALTTRAFGGDRVVALLLQEKESSPENAAFVRTLARQLTVPLIAEDITGALEGFGCYRRRDEAIQRVFPEYDSTYLSKISLPGDLLNRGSLNLFSLTIISPEGEAQTKRLPLAAYLEIVAATNFKQRARMAMLYHHAERRNYAVIGTANKNERDQGFFVKYGDGGADVDAIVHLYKTQVYQLAEYLEVPEAIRRRPPTTDTYSAPSTEEEFFFRMPFETMDLLWYAQEHLVPAEEAARVMELSVAQVERAYRDFEQKRRATEYLRSRILTV